MKNKTWEFYKEKNLYGGVFPLRDMIFSQNKSERKGTLGFKAGGDKKSIVLIIERKIMELESLIRDFSFNASEMKGMSIEERQEYKLLKLGEVFLNAARDCDVPLGQEFIDHGFPVNYQDPKTGSTALHIAATYSAREFVRILLKSRKCDFFIKDKNRRTALVVANQFGEDIPVELTIYRKTMRQADEQGVDYYGDIHEYIPREL